tara:strand:+ start:1513 stop:1953 length:441 start_codon:yes stop_codon:yes gene_type:complete
MTQKFLIWWLVAVVQVIAVGIGIHYGAVPFLIENDITKLSFVIFTMWLISSASVGYKVWKQEEDFDKPWFVAESCMTVGMIGTVIGFILMLGSSFQEIDPSNIESMRKVIVDMAAGMSTALLTTLCGLLAGLFIKVQIVMQEQDDV